MGNALKIEAVGSDANPDDRGHSQHTNTRRFAMYILAELANDTDRYGTIYMRRLADRLGVSERGAQMIVRHLESSGEITVWDRPNDSCMYRINDLLVHHWPTSYIQGKLLDRRQRPKWTADDDANRKAYAHIIRAERQNRG